MSCSEGQTMTKLRSMILCLLLATLILSSCQVSHGPVETDQPATATPLSDIPQAKATDPPPARPTEKHTPQATTVAAPPGQVVNLTIVYDNNPFDPQLKSLWGFACLVQYGVHTLLFDTGGDGPTLLENMEKLGIDPSQIEAVFLSHEHGDHTGGLETLLQVNRNIDVYAPTRFAERIRSQVESAGARLVKIDKPVEIFPGVHSTGQVSGPVDEQALALESPQGLVVVTGCAHPGVVRLVSAARECTEEEPYLVLGGFHLSNDSSATVKQVVAELQQVGVQKAAPTHCSGDGTRDLFAEVYGNDYVEVGVGWSMTIGE